ncbi:MAG: cytochrome c biogenesis protein CcsA [Chloroflexota bacterium]|nr:cytochrome c biogenesis protein CcsA [Chloroflexota bacterium]
MTKKPKLLTLLDILCLVLVPAALVLILFFTPTERVMGPVQKVFYFHVSAAWAGMLSFLLAAAAGAGYLITREEKWDWLSLSTIEVGLVFGLIAILSGMIWAQPIWNTWWVWDPRLTTTAIMELIYLAYFILRSSLDTIESRARLGAVYAIISAATVPLTFFSIRLFRTIHPVVIAMGGDGGSAFNMTPRMQLAFFSSLIVFTLLLSDLVWHRYRLARLQAANRGEGV